MTETRANPTSNGVEKVTTKSNQVMSMDPIKPNPPVRGNGLVCKERLLGISIILSKLTNLINQKIVR